MWWIAFEVGSRASATGSRRSWNRWRLAGCDREDGDRPGRLVLVGRVAITVVRIDQLPNAVVPGIRWLDDRGDGRLPLASDLDLVRSEASVLARVAGGYDRLRLNGFHLRSRWLSTLVLLADDRFGDTVMLPVGGA